MQVRSVSTAAPEVFIDLMLLGLAPALGADHDDALGRVVQSEASVVAQMGRVAVFEGSWKSSVTLFADFVGSHVSASLDAARL